MSTENTNLSNFELKRIFDRAEKIFFVGIGGISMSSLAQYCIYNGKSVFGYDRARGEECKRLEKSAHIRYCSSPDSVMGMDLVIYSNAIDEDNFELKRAKEMKIPVVSRANFMGFLMSDYRVRIGVSGMHGKSTVTSMLSHIFRHAGTDPTVICGAKMKGPCAPYRFGKRDFFIFEACEYMNSFLSLCPSDAIVTNIDFDHADFFTDMAHIKRSFREYILPAKRVFINADDENSACLCHPFKITFGIDSDADYMAKIDTESAKNAFTVIKNGTELAHITLKELGRHNVYNALCAFAVASEHCIPHKTIACALSSFEGVARRLELLRKIKTNSNENGHSVPLFLDYAHHPREIRASLDALVGAGFERILCIFQAHTYSRTYALYSEFLSAFKGASDLIVTPIYPAREVNVYPISDEGFARDLGAKFMSEYSLIAEYISGSEADAVVIMGAGDIEALKNYIN